MRFALLIVLAMSSASFTNASLAGPLDDPTIQKIVHSKTVQARITRFIAAGKHAGLIAITTAELAPEDVETARKFMIQLWEKNREALELNHAEDLERRFTEAERGLLVAFFENDALQGALERFENTDVTLHEGYQSVVTATQELLAQRIAELKND